MNANTPTYQATATPNPNHSFPRTSLGWISWVSLGSLRNRASVVRLDGAMGPLVSNGFRRCPLKFGAGV
jgi:hypothetical protein